MNKKPAVNKIHISAGFGGSPTADSRFAVPCPTGQERAPKSVRQHVPTVVANVEKSNRCTKKNIYQQIKITKKPKCHEKNKLTYYRNSVDWFY